MIKVTKEQWEHIPNEYKGVWTKQTKDKAFQLNLPNKFIGKKNVMGNCISDRFVGLLTESIHFEIV